MRKSANWAPLFLLGSSLTCAASCERESTPGADTPTREEVAALLQRNMRSWETGDDDAFLTLHDDVILAYPGKRLTKEGVLEASKVWRSEFRDTKVKLGRLVIEGNQFAVEYLYAATHIPTGKRQAVGTVAIGEVRDGKIYVWKEYLDGRISRMQAKGELPVDDTAEPYPWPDTPESRVP